MEIDPITKNIIYPLKEVIQTEPTKVFYEDLASKPVFIARTAVAVDLSGSATTLVCLHTEIEAEIIRAFLLYTEASSADAGITIEVGKESDRDYYYTGTTETSKAIWYTKEITLLQQDVVAGDTITFYSAGGKTGTGEIMLVIEYKLKGI